MLDHSTVPTSPSSRPDPPPRLVRLGWDARVASLVMPLLEDSPETVAARVSRVERSGCVLALEDGDEPARSPAGMRLAVGDWVTARRREGVLELAAVAPRWSQLTRRDPSGDVQILAANIDVVLIAVPADRMSLARAEREVVLAWDSGARPIVLVTKADLAGDDTVAAVGDRLIGVDVLAVSTVTGDGLPEVAEVLRPRRTAVLLGPSGAGKSSLLNGLLGRERVQVGDVRAGDRRGRHTTTARELVEIPSGGVLVDTPGLRSVSLTGGEDLAEAFADVEELAAACRFGDCGHVTEPGCAVRAAIETGQLSEERMASYLKLQRELQFEARREDPELRAEAKRQVKRLHREIRRVNRERPDR